MIGGRRGGMSAEEFLAQYERLVEKLDSGYSYRIARELENFRSDPVLGYRTAGSAAEFEAGEYLFGEMVRLGLRTEKHPVRIDGWEYKGASLTYETKEGSKTVLLGGYQTHFVAKGLKTELVDAGKGTEKDFAGTDVRGKIALIRINQRDEWWINYPAYQAHLAGALAVIAVQDKGYGEADPSALNAQDICGLPEAAAFSMSKRDMLDIVKEMDKGRIEVTLDADSRVTKDATAYNIVGTIPGKTSEMIAVSAHYDSYFHGFEDDNTGISMMLSLAKAVAESGYLPEKTLVFIAFACEEWGRTDSRYDWSAGAFAEMTQGMNDWRGKMIADINLELPAIAHGKKHYIRSVYEYKHFLRDFLKDPKGFDEYYPEGADVVCPVQTWSDDFSMAVNGVPSMVNEFASGSFMETHYHSQLDDHSSYDEKIYDFHHRLYLRLLLAFDRCALPPMDFSTRIRRMGKSLKRELLCEKTADAFGEALSLAEDAAETLYAMICEVNDSKQPEERESVAAAVLLDVFRFCEDNFVALDWYEKSVFPHENAQKNIEYLGRALACLERSDADGAKTALVEVDDNSYAEAFDRRVTSYFTARALADEGTWGSGRLTGHIDLFGLLRSVLSKRKEEDPDFSAEKNELAAHIAAEKKNLAYFAEIETARLHELTKKLEGAMIAVEALGR